VGRDHRSQRFVGEFADFFEKGAREHWIPLGVDDEHPSIADDHHGVRIPETKTLGLKSSVDAVREHAHLNLCD